MTEENGEGGMTRAETFRHHRHALAVSPDALSEARRNRLILGFAGLVHDLGIVFVEVERKPRGWRVSHGV
jgi:hypothetical protein